MFSKKPLLAIVSQVYTYACALSFLFGSLAVLNALEIDYFYYFPRKIRITIFDPNVDILIWVVSTVCLMLLSIQFWKEKWRKTFQVGLIGLAVIVMTFMFLRPDKAITSFLFTIVVIEFVFLILSPKPVFVGSTRVLVSRVFVYLLASLLLIEVSSGTHYILRAFDRVTQIGKVDAEIELQISYALYGLLPWLYVAFLFSWVWIPFLRRILPKIRLLKFRPIKEITGARDLHIPSVGDKRLSFLADHWLFLAVAAAIFIGYYPYFQNPPWLVGTDAYWRYYNPLLRMNAEGFAGAFSQSLKEWHPLTVMLLYGVQKLLGSTAFEVVRLTPVFLVLFLGCSMWWFLARKMRRNFGLTVFLFSVLSLTTTVGMYASILSNWLALAGWALFFGFVAFRSDEGLRLLDIPILLAISSFILLVHPWTWGVFAASILIFAVTTLLSEKRKRWRFVAPIVFIIAIDVFLALLSVSVLNAGGALKITETISLYGEAVRDPSSLLVFWQTLTRLTQVWSAFFSPLYVATSILGVLYLQKSGLTKNRQDLIIAWICAAAIGSVLVAPIGFDPSQPTRSESQLWRLLFLTPFQLTAPLGAFFIIESSKRLTMMKNKLTDEHSRQSLAQVLVGIVFVIGFMLAWAPMQARIVISLILLPLIIGFGLYKKDGEESNLLGVIIAAFFALVFFNNTTRCLAQLLINPHNYRP